MSAGVVKSLVAVLLAAMMMTSGCTTSHYITAGIMATAVVVTMAVSEDDPEVEEVGEEDQ